MLLKLLLRSVRPLKKRDTTLLTNWQGIFCLVIRHTLLAMVMPEVKYANLNGMN